MSEFVGHFHVALIHLPIGILLIALLLLWLRKNPKYNISYQVIKIILLIGVVFALLSCITGYVLSTTDNYEKPLVEWHMWMGFGVAIASMFLYMKLARSEFDILYKILAVGLFALIVITGHLGGSLTHGSDYISFNFSSDKNDTAKIKPLVNVQEVKVYDSVIQPILQTRCYTCHSSKRQKGGLRLDKYDLILKGGKDGKIITTGEPDNSDMIKRILLPEEEDKHMPPREKPQLTDKQIALLHWWIENGNDTLRKVKQMPQPDPIKGYLISLQVGHEEHKLPANIPLVPVEKADDKAVEPLKNKGVIVLPIAQNSNYLSVNFVTATNVSDKDFALLLPLKKQLVWLKCGDTKIGDSALSFIAQCTNLTFLQLDNTSITDKGLQKLSLLQQLQSLNLVGTDITAVGLKALKNLKQLQSIYVYKTKINKEDFAELQKDFPKVLIDSGGYNVPLFPD
ncbi:MAG TPA: c-type cytochrome domain-containing protein, partial [Parafilimonas sp.]|nr:c-type cytochrome domain-containing protein [Parafilimonas sp.]